MSPRILQLNFKFSVTRSEYEEAVASMASDFAAVAGLRWKVWILNESESEAGGIYLFDDESSMKAFLAGPLAATVREHPAFSDMSAKQFEVMADATATTRGPV